MGSIIKTWAEKDQFTLFFCSGVFLVIASVIFILRINQPKIESENDLKFLKGRLTEHHNERTGYGVTDDCWFMLDGYSNMFSIDRDDRGKMDMRGFAALTDGDSVITAFPKRDTLKLNNASEPIFIYSFRCKSVVLDYHKVIKSYNGYIMYGVGSLVFLVSVFLFYLGCTTKNKTKPW